jgi:hypothetical protein
MIHLYYIVIPLLFYIVIPLFQLPRPATVLKGSNVRGLFTSERYFPLEAPDEPATFWSRYEGHLTFVPYSDSLELPVRNIVMISLESGNK